MVQSVSISSVRPRVRNSTRPDSEADNCGRRRAAMSRLGDRLGPDAVNRQHADRVGADAEERRMAERDDAGIAEREIERQRKQDGDQQFGAEAEIIGKGK